MADIVWKILSVLLALVLIINIFDRVGPLKIALVVIARLLALSIDGIIGIIGLGPAGFLIFAIIVKLSTTKPDKR